VTTAVKTDAALYEFVLRMGDNAVILAQRVGAWCGHAPVLEEDIALANVALDLIGQTQMWLGYAGEIGGDGKSADDLAFLRDVRAFRNCLLVEQPNGDFAHTLMRQFLFDAWHLPMLRALKASSERRVAEIAEKAEKEARYHLEKSEDLIIRLGDGSEESHVRMQTALDALYPFAGELCSPDKIDDELAARGVAPDLREIEKTYLDYLKETLGEATLIAPWDAMVRKGGKQGLHSEELGYVLAELQWMQRAYPGMKW
jgi:ring-1,2-phenylacetyl-CoA epoxidase subunit PaaC